MPTARRDQLTEEMYIRAAWKSAPNQQRSLSTPDNLPLNPNLKISSFCVILLPQQKDNVGLGLLRRKILSKVLEIRKPGLLILTLSLPRTKLALEHLCNGTVFHPRPAPPLAQPHTM